jgi:hypothetical protein
MGAIFAAASAGTDATATLLGMQATFRVAMTLALAALGLAVFCWRAAARRKTRVQG